MDRIEDIRIISGIKKRSYSKEPLSTLSLNAASLISGDFAYRETLL